MRTDSAVQWLVASYQNLLVLSAEMLRHAQSSSDVNKQAALGHSERKTCGQNLVKLLTGTGLIWQLSEAESYAKRQHIGSHSAVRCLVAGVLLSGNRMRVGRAGKGDLFLSNCLQSVFVIT